MSNYDQNFAQDAGYAAGAAEGEYDRAGQALNHGEQRVENAPGEFARDAEQGWDRTEQDVKDAPSALGDAFNKAASWVGEKMGATENEGRQAEQGVENKYNEASNDMNRFGQGAQNEYNETSNDVNQFGQGVQDSYNQGEDQGRQQGW